MSSTRASSTARSDRAGSGSGHHDRAVLRRLVLQARRYWPLLALILALDLAATPLALLSPLPLKIVVDSVLGAAPLPHVLQRLTMALGVRSDTALLAFAAALMVAITVMFQLQGLVSWLLHTYVGERMVADWRAQLFRQAHRVSFSYHDTKGTADTIYRIQWDAPCIRHLLVDTGLPLISAWVKLAAMIYVTARINWRLAVVALSVSPVLYLISYAFRTPLRERYGHAQVIEMAALKLIQEVLTALRVVKAFGKERHERERFADLSNEGVRAQCRAELVKSNYDLLVAIATTGGGAAVLVLGARAVQAGTITLGDLLIVMAYLAQLFGPLSTISNKFASMQGLLTQAERVFAFLDEAPVVVERPHARAIARAAGAVAFRGVWFAYGAGPSVLRDVSFEIAPGTRVGIAGPTGAGKTTLVNLLVRFYDPTAGRILLDGVDLRDYALDALRDQFAIVLQEPVLFATTIAENIAYARADAPRSDIVAAAKAANAHEFIARLPDGYRTQVGERGMQLSGGERQRLSLARAFLKDAPILILDEPTSSVDVKTEAGIMDAMNRLMRERTTFMIAHRLSTLDGCDIRMELDRGRIVGVRPVVPGAGASRGSVLSIESARGGMR